jgi:hypothetical protein
VSLRTAGRQLQAAVNEKGALNENLSECMTHQAVNNEKNEDLRRQLLEGKSWLESVEASIRHLSKQNDLLKPQ